MFSAPVKHAEQSGCAHGTNIAREPPTRPQTEHPPSPVSFPTLAVFLSISLALRSPSSLGTGSAYGGDDSSDCLCP